MAACFSLTKIGETEPAVLQEVDNDMARFFGVEPDPVKWYRNWYNEVGFRLALGWSLDKITQEYPEWVSVCDWLQANYTSDAWRGQ